MKSLERAYTQIASGVSLILEDVDGSGLAPISDQELHNAQVVPQQFQKNVIPGSSKAYFGSNPTSKWYIEFSLKFSAKQWTDGTEEPDVTYSYVEREVSNQLPNTGDNPGQSFCHSHAIVDEEQSNNGLIVVRCIISGGMDI